MGMLTTHRKWAFCFKTLHWALLLYLCVASLHGLVPGLWGHHDDEGPGQGPFRVLLFTLVVLAVAFVLASRQRAVHARHLLVIQLPPQRHCWSPRQLRAPPSHS